MKWLPIILALSACLLSAETPNLSGVWKASPEKSKVTGGPPPTNLIMIIEQKDSMISSKIGSFGQREQRSSFTYNTARPNTNAVNGIPMRAKSSWEGNALVVEEHVGGAHPADVHEKYTLSEDGNTLTVESTRNINGREMASTIVYEKQPDSAGEPLRKPEETAGVHYKNVQLLKDVPASQFIDAMRSFSFALGENCDFCHVQGNFAADDKPQKAMARKMITMTTNINQANFNGQMRVRCFTCHQGHQEPHSMPE
jgi:Photosynthetic reaction centre cytochrome C subunit